MTCLTRILQILNDDNLDMDADTVEKLVTVAYHMGREHATKEVSDKYSNHIAEQKRRAAACRYRKMAEAVVGPEDYLYNGDYAGDFTKAFGSDETSF